MERQSVTSTDIRSIGYDTDMDTLEIEFHSGEIYHYFNVPEMVRAVLMGASSKGRYLNSYIKDRYRYRKIQ